MTDDPPKISPEVLIAAHREGQANAAFHLDCAESLTRQANAWLALLAAAAFAAIGYAAHLWESGTDRWPVAVGAFALAVHLLLVARGIVRRCLYAREYLPAHNEPRHLLYAGFAWHEILEGEINTLSESIDRNAASNAAVGAALNRLRMATFWAPLTFLVAAAAAAARAAAFGF